MIPTPHELELSLLPPGDDSAEAGLLLADRQGPVPELRDKTSPGTRQAIVKPIPGYLLARGVALAPVLGHLVVAHDHEPLLVAVALLVDVGEAQQVVEAGLEHAHERRRGAVGPRTG